MYCSSWLICSQTNGYIHAYLSLMLHTVLHTFQHWFSLPRVKLWFKTIWGLPSLAVKSKLSQSQVLFSLVSVQQTRFYYLGVFLVSWHSVEISNSSHSEWVLSWVGQYEPALLQCYCGNTFYPLACMDIIPNFANWYLVISQNCFIEKRFNPFRPTFTISLYLQ